MIFKGKRKSQGIPPVSRNQASTVKVLEQDYFYHKNK